MHLIHLLTCLLTSLLTFFAHSLTHFPLPYTYLLDIAAQCDSCVTTVVIGDDWVPRLSLLAMENVRDAVVACLVEASLAGETEFATWWRALSDAWGWTICRSKYAAVEAVAVAAAEVATADEEE